MRRLWDAVRRPFRTRALEKAIKEMGEHTSDKFKDDFLQTLLSLMSVYIFLDHKFRRNIENFNGRFVFESKNKKIATSAIFGKNRMKVKKSAVDDSDIKVIFKDGNALWDFLFSPNPDIFGFILDNKLTYRGNANYIFKFAYMAKHLQLKFSF